MKPFHSLSTLSVLGKLILSIGLIASSYADGLSNAYFTDKNPQLTPQERAAIGCTSLPVCGPLIGCP